ncbi:hypothetical protein GP486_003445 [Trichoglossum hirsutum]|uniref:DUF1531-domain-containing protein n=1 Tax=Trichoglossum hirsutum TaxID=265104 RepID=A0A9P8LD20_9PEZI|nr:hypothetical protein GP486_003445 [Trichoglossum hirsutum]
MQKATEYLQTWAGNLQRNVSNSVSRLSLKDYIRIVILLGGYALLRPYLLKLAGKFQARDHERELSPNEMTSDAAMPASSLRNRIQVPEDTDDEDESSAAGVDWGRSARRRQRKVIRKLLEAEEKRLAEEGEDSDKDIEEFLE